MQMYIRLVQLTMECKEMLHGDMKYWINFENMHSIIHVQQPFEVKYMETCTRYKLINDRMDKRI